MMTVLQIIGGVWAICALMFGIFVLWALFMTDDDEEVER